MNPVVALRNRNRSRPELVRMHTFIISRMAADLPKRSGRNKRVSRATIEVDRELTKLKESIGGVGLDAPNRYP
jgi:hypothetical protein